ncbi:MAG: VWA domain-containing protein, partial [Chloroflexi bacterium]
LLLAAPIVIYLGWPRQRYRRARDMVSLVLRLVIMLLLILAISGTQVVRTADRLAVVFLVDVSDSVSPEAQEAALDYIREALNAMGPDDEFGVVVFGADPAIERRINIARELGPIRSTPITSNTNIEEAIQTGLSLLPGDAAGRLVLLSDGHATVGNTDAAAQFAAASGIEISYVPLEREPSPEVQVTDVRVPSAVNAQQEFDLSITVEAEEATPATITILASGEIIHREDVNLREGANNYTLALQGGGSGFKDFRVQVDPTSNDGFFQNNQLSTFTQVIGPPRVLLVHNNEEEIQFLLPALQEAGLTVDVATPNSLPIGLAPLAQFSSVILANVPATELSPQRMTILERYVKDLGGGLVVIGGPDAYGAGGYFQTPLEDALPLEMRIRDQQRLPQLTIAYVIDRSGSMGAVSPSGIPHIELAKEAMIRSIDFLQPTDRAGVVSFDSQGYWIANLQPVQDRLGLQRLIGSLRPGGGTDILAGMNLVADTIVNDESERKHIILLTDGGAAPTGLVDLARDMFQNSDVTTSVIAIGAGAAPFLEDMAREGGGNYHIVDDADSIPAIFTVETVLATRSYITEEEFFPSLTAESAITNGITSSPSLLGYVAATPKQTAQVIMRAPEPFADPILAAWQYGLGRSVAFTSDASSRWGANWVQWDNFSRFWSQAVRWTITEGSNNLETRVEFTGEQARLIIDARDSDGDFLNALNMTASIVDPNVDSQSIDLQQVAPGRYEATFLPEDEGAYFLRINGTSVVNGETVEVSQTSGWVLSYSPEYSLAQTGANTELLEDIAVLTGGRSLQDDPSAAFAHNLDARNAVTPIWQWLLIVAVALLPLDIAVRRLVITRRDLQRARQAIFGGAKTVADVPSERISTLMGAKERAQLRTEQQANPSATVSALRSRREQARHAHDESAAAATPTQAQSHRKTVSRQSAKAAGDKKSGGNIAGELLKRRRGDDTKDDE